MPLEIERKFFIPAPPDFLAGISFKSIQQGYIAIEKDGNAVRVRQIDNEYWLTAKSAGSLDRKEVEFLITRNIFLKLWDLTEGRRIEKHRYQWDHNDGPIEIDVFQGNLIGLTLAEIEFNSIQEASDFVPPSWLGQEVTSNPYFKNRNLSAMADYLAVLKIL